MRRRKKDNVEWLEFDLLADIPNLVHGVFLRHGGYSTGPYDSLNAGGGSGDDRECIRKNREKIQELLKIPMIVAGNQVHGNNVEIVTPSFADNIDCDGLVTSEENIGLMIKHADCQAAIFFDPILRLLANVHCGWRGSVKNIYANTIDKMKSLGSNPQNILVCISPSLGPLAAEFKHYSSELPESFWEFQIKPTYFDFWSISRQQLEKCGILRHHIEIASLCTVAEAKDFFSYRRDKITGRNATLVALKKN